MTGQGPKGCRSGQGRMRHPLRRGFDSHRLHVYAEEWLTCLDPECGAPAVADEPIQHDSTNGPVLSWVVHCANGHHLTDYTEPIWGFDTPRE